MPRDIYMVVIMITGYGQLQCTNTGQSWKSQIMNVYIYVLYIHTIEELMVVLVILQHPNFCGFGQTVAHAEHPTNDKDALASADSCRESSLYS